MRTNKTVADIIESGTDVVKSQLGGATLVRTIRNTRAQLTPTKSAKRATTRHGSRRTLEPSALWMTDGKAGFNM